MATAAELLESARQQSDLDEKDIEHWRGHFSTLRCGVSHGGGQTQPGNLCNNSTNTAVAEGLNASEPFIRLAGYANCKCLRLFFAQLFT